MRQVNKLQLVNNNTVADNIDKIKELFPHCVSEALVNGKLTQAIDLKKLLIELGIEDNSESIERYEFTWPNKRDALRKANEPTTNTLRPCIADSINFEHTRNLYLEGDNLDVLKCLRKSYLGKVKMIYIDPPYNTGSDLIYDDNFTQEQDSYLKESAQVDELGYRLVANKETNGRFHTDWLNMIYPRLRIARDLLTEDGAIFISIDENEMDNVKKICDELFGQDNFVASLVWAAGRKNDSKLISISHEYIICYVKNNSYLKQNDIVWREIKQGLEYIYKKYDSLKKQYKSNYSEIEKELKSWYSQLPSNHPAKQHSHYNQVDERGIFFGADISWPGGGGPKYDVFHPVTHKKVKTPSRGWITNEAKMLQLVADNRVHFGPDEKKVPTLKTYLKDRELSVPYSVFYTDGRAASKRLATLMDGKVFDNPKDEEVLARIIEFCNLTDDDIVLDFFSGSATTAHAVFIANIKQKLNRRFIMVQYPEAIDLDKGSKSSAKEVAKNAIKLCNEIQRPANICTIAKERIKRAGIQVSKLLAERQASAQEQEESSMPLFSTATENLVEPEHFTLDVGFRVLKLDSSNMEEVFYSPDKLSQQSLLLAVDPIKSDRSDEDLLFQVMLDLGLDLTSPILTVDLEQGRAFKVMTEFDDINPFMIFYCGAELDITTFTQLLKLQPSYLVLKDSDITSDSLITNYKHLLTTYSPDTTINII